jgi:serine protease Do
VTRSFRWLLAAVPLALLARGAVAQRTAPAPDPAAERRSAIGIAAARIAPAVVSVNVVRRVRSLPRTMLDAYMMPRGFEQLVEGLGTGFIVSADGLIITNQHVTAGADSIVVTLRDGTDLPARLLGEDARTDIAVLKVDTTGLPVAVRGSSRRLQIGDWVVAVGNPYGYLLGNSEPSVTAGVVSGLNRDLLPNDERGGVGSGLYVDMIQTDAAINPGNSGGPLVNAAGEVVGVNAFILTQSGGNVGLGFAIPIERALRVAQEIRANGRVRRGWIGLEIAPRARSATSWRRQTGVPIQRIAPGGPADRAGLKPDDVIDMVGGQRVRNFLNWEKALVDLGVGDTLRLTLHRGGRSQDVLLVASDLPSESATRVAFADLQLITVTPAVQAERQLASARGALVVAVGAESGRRLGLRPGDVVLQINNFPITTAPQASDVLEYARTHSGAFRVYFERDRQLQFADYWGGNR